MSLLLASKKVAVIGAGAAGLSAARELKREGHGVVVFERGGQLGGVWVYSPESESDPLGLDPTRKIVHSSLYASLRINFPREAMGFREFPFAPSGNNLSFVVFYSIVQLLSLFPLCSIRYCPFNYIISLTV